MGMRQAAALLAAALVLLGGCGSTGQTNEQTTPQTTEQTTQQTPQEAETAMPSTPADRAEHRERTLEILSGAYRQLDVPDKPDLVDRKGPGAEIDCTLGGPRSATAWGERAGIDVGEQEVETQAERVRAWLDDEGFERLELRNMTGTTGHRLDGYSILVKAWPDGRVTLEAESPCVDEEGNRVGA